MSLNGNALITVAMAKSHLAIPASSPLEDVRLELMINAASENFERWCDRKIRAATYVEYHHGRNQNVLIPLEFPIVSIQEIRVSSTRDWTDVNTLIPSTDYGLVDYDQAIQYFGSFPRGFGNIRLVYDGGYTTVPSDLQMACLWAVEWFYRHRERGDIGRTQLSKGDESVGVLASMPPMITEILSNYKRTEMPAATAPIRML